MKRLPSYVQQLPDGRFNFRIAVPKSLRPYFGQREIKKSLCAERPAEAFGMAQAIAAMVQQAFHECQVVVNKREPKFIQQILITLGDGVDRKEIRINRDSPAEETEIAARLLESLPLTAPKYTGIPVAASPSLTTVIAEYRAEKLQERSWKPKTVDENNSIFELLIEIVGDIAISSIDIGVAQEVKKTLKKLPPNVHKIPMYRGKTLREVIAMNPTNTLTVNTINKYLGRISSLMDWSIKQGHLAVNPFSGLRLKKPKRAYEERDEFSSEDLAALFGTPIFTAGNYRNPYYYWLPLLGLYSGARIEELCQLSLSDIHQRDGIWVIDINELEEKDVKTAAGKRLVPIHSELTRLGFLDYVDRLRDRKETRLFPELTRQRDGYSQAAQKWFNARYRHRCGVSKRGKSFHSFRHTFINHLKQKDQDAKKMAALVGHSDPSITTGRYGKPYPVQALLEVMTIVDFELRLPKVFKNI